MIVFRRLEATLCLVSCFLFASQAQAQIVVDYSFDQANQDFFGNNPVARAALEAAVSDINQIINPNLSAITDDVIVGTSGGGSTEIRFDFSYSIRNPATGVIETISDTRLPEKDVRIFVGARNLGGSILGQGGSGGAGLAISGFVGSGSIFDAVASAQANEQHRRDGGPLIASLDGDVNGVPFSFGLGPTVGNMWFDQDTNNDGIADDSATLESSWHFDHTTDVAAGKNDFYSVALHETMHAIGFGGSESWDSLVNGSNWLGDEFISINGTGTNVINGGHLASNLVGRSLRDGAMQQPLMSPSILQGTRKYLTDLDVAVLTDIGAVTATAIPEPSSTALLLLACGCVTARRRRRAARLH
ncbi:MAG: PEP-CTERM sorting domain-containing protein [Planctomycetota bacterium]